MSPTPPYSVHPSIPYAQKIIANLEAKTGQSLDEWVRYVRQEGPEAEADRRVWLKERHHLGTNYAWWIAERAGGRGWENDDPAAYLAKAPEYVEAMFGGKRAALRPIYDMVLARALAIAPDVKACPCQTIVPLYRQHVFAEIKPATITRLDLGLALGTTTGRIPARIQPVPNAGKNRISHRIPITRVEEVDRFVDRWLRTAYDADR